MAQLDDLHTAAPRQWVVRGHHLPRCLPFRERMLLLRGLPPGAERDLFLFPEPHLKLGGLLGDPASLPDAEIAVDRLVLALSAGERICVYGDYDADGVTATAVLVRGLRQLGGRVEYYIPHRVQEGFGLHEVPVRALAGQRFGLLVTVDCGTSDGAEVDIASSLGMDVIITDHHALPPTLPSAVAVVNPQRQVGSYPDRRLTGAGVAYTLLRALAYRLGPGARVAASDLVQLAALGTIADVAPLLGENRLLVRAGLAALNRSPLPGVRALLVASGHRAGSVTESDVAYKLAPRLNAAGRMAHASLACDLLLETDPSHARRLAQELEQLNLARRETSDGMLAVAERMVEQSPAIQEDALTVYSDDWSPALLGIVAGRLAKLHGVPVVAATLDEGGTVRASARSVPGLDITAALDQCKHLLSEHGGHSQAAGFSTTLEGLRSVHEHLLAHFAGARTAACLEVDLELTQEELTPAIAVDLELLAPFGAENPEPVLGVGGARPREVRVFGKQGDHLSFVLKGASGAAVEVIGWGMASECTRLSQSKCVDLVVRPLRQQNGSFSPLRLVLDKALPRLE